MNRRWRASSTRADKKLQCALEAWQRKFIDWWKEMGPEGFQEDDIYLRTAVSVDHQSRSPVP